MRKLSPEHQAQRATNAADKTSFVSSRGVLWRLQYELEDAVAANDQLQAENASLRTELTMLGRHQEEP